MKKQIKAVGLKKGDAVIIILLLCVCLVWFGLSSVDKGSEKRISVYASGEPVYQVRLSEITEPFERKFDGVILLFESDGVSFKQSDCTNQLCIKSGKLKEAGQSMACVPNKVVVTVTADRNNFDIVSY